MTKKVSKDKKLDFSKYWAEAIYRKRYENQDVIFAYVRRKYSYEDVNMDGEGLWVGLTEKQIPKMKIDNDPDSDTYGQRVPDFNEVRYQDGHVEKIPVVNNVKFEYEYKATPENIKKFKELYGSTIQGTTQLIWCLTGRNYTCEYPDDFWKSELKDVEDHIRKRKSIRNAEQA